MTEHPHVSLLEYEDLLKTLDRARWMADGAARSNVCLDDKVRFYRLKKDLEVARRSLLKRHFDFEDATKVHIKCCPECGDVQP